MSRFVRAVMVGVALSWAGSASSCEVDKPNIAEYVNQYYQNYDGVLLMAKEPVQVIKEDGTIIIQAANADKKGWSKIEEGFYPGIKDYKEDKLNFNGRVISVIYAPDKYRIGQEDPHTWHLSPK